MTEQKELEDVRKYLEEGKKLVLKRKKLIKLADREDWSVVTEYMSDNLASSSEDEKRINRERKTANAKSEKARKIKIARRERYEKLSRPGEERFCVRTNEYRSCWNCGRVGHVMSQCHTKDYNRGNLNRSQFHSRDSFFKDKKSSLRDQEFVETAKEELLKQNCIKELECMPFCCNPLTVAERGDKLRLVIDLRHVNDNLDFPKFKYEDLRVARQHFEKDFFFTTFDLKSGYHHIHEKYMRKIKNM